MLKLLFTASAVVLALKAKSAHAGIFTKKCPECGKVERVSCSEHATHTCSCGTKITVDSSGKTLNVDRRFTKPDHKVY